jgi:hypothetical protein
MTIVTSDIRIVVIRANNNTSLNNYTIVNIGTIKATTDIIYNRESDIVLI